MRLALLFSIILLMGCKQQTNWTLSSPDESLSIEFNLEDGQLYYGVKSMENGNPQVVLDKSSLGIQTQNYSFGTGLKFAKASNIVSIEEEYEQISGKLKRVDSKSNSLMLEFTNTEGVRMNVEARAFNDGVAFRYIFPDESDNALVVEEDLTSFNFSNGGKAWLSPYDEPTKYTPAYENYFQNGIEIGSPSPSNRGWYFPALFNSSNHWILVSEAGIDGNFAGLHLQPTCENGNYKLRLPEAEEGLGVHEQKPSSTTPWETPWKAIIIGKNLNTLVTSNMINNLNPASKISDISWIKPGRSAWSWLSDHPSPRDFEKQKKFVDLAAEMGWEYSLVDANWDKMEGGTIEQVIEYANQKNVGILMWYNSGGLHNDVTEAPRDLMDNPEKRKAEFARLQQLGVKGVKIDFFQSDKQETMKQYKGILEDAAQHQILVNFHGCTMPRGWSRTYPHLLSMEAVKGAECYTFAKDYPENAPLLNTILPFTRNVIGPMDYTPVIFTDMQFPHITTNGHELALAVVFETGILHFGDGVEGYRSLPEPVKQLLKDIPVTWEETRLISGYPGKDVVIARKNGNKWYIAGINGENSEKTIQVDLSGLGLGSNLTFYGDGNDKSWQTSPTDLEQLKAGVTLLPYGGFFVVGEQLAQ